MPDPERLEILVDTDVQVPSAGTPRRVMEAIRRHLRQHSAGSSTPGPAPAESPLALIHTREGQHRMPQGLLPTLTETCRRQGIAYTVVDRRAMVSCPALRSRLQLGEPEREALRRLLLRDSGVLIAGEPASRAAIAIELLARRQQRTLIVTAGPDVERWVSELREALGVPAALCDTLRRATAETRVVVGGYLGVLQLPPAALRGEYGMVIFDRVDLIDALTLMKVVREVGARYLLGLAAAASRPDGLQGTVQLALGGVAHQLRPAPAATLAAARLACRFQPTTFAFAYEGRSQYQALVAALARDPERARLIAADIEREAAAGHACLVLSERRDHLEALAAQLPPSLPLEVLTSTVRPAERAQIIARFESGELVALLATSQIAAETLASPRVSRLFITFPFSYARKLEGAVRLLLQPHPGKLDGVLFDYDDAQLPPLHRAFEKRRVHLERLARDAEAAAAAAAQMTLPLD